MMDFSTMTGDDSSITHWGKKPAFFQVPKYLHNIKDRIRKNLINEPEFQKQSPPNYKEEWPII